MDFAIDTFKDSEHKHQVPIQPTLMEEFRDLFNYSVKHKGGLVSSMLMKDDEGGISYAALFSVYILPVLIVIAFYYMMEAAYSTDDDCVERTEILNELNRREKQKIDNWVKKHPTLRHKHRKWEWNCEFSLEKRIFLAQIYILKKQTDNIQIMLY